MNKKRQTLFRQLTPKPSTSFHQTLQNIVDLPQQMNVANDVLILSAITLWQWGFLSLLAMASLLSGVWLGLLDVGNTGIIDLYSVYTEDLYNPYSPLTL